MLAEFFLPGVAIAAILLYLAYVESEGSPRVHLIATGGLLLVILGLFLAMNGLEVKTGEPYLVNTTQLYAYESGNISNITTNYAYENMTYAHSTMDFAFSEGLAIILILSGIGFMLVFPAFLNPKPDE